MTAQPVADQALRRTDRWRPFSHEGRRYAHVSAVPLVYLSGSAPLFDLLDRFTVPRRPADALPAPTPADRRFLAALVRVGVLPDATAPDAIHTLRADGPTRRSLTLYPTNSCNLRCVYCYATSGPGAGPRLSVEHALLAVDDFFDTLDDGVRAVGLGFHGGGEPTTNAAVLVAASQRFAERARGAGIAYGLSTITNGTFGPAARRMLIEGGWRVTVSYDGPRQSVQRPTAADRDSRDRVSANLRALVAAGVPVVIRATLTRDGLGSLRDLVDDVADLGVPRVQVEPASVVGRGAGLLDGPPDPADFAEAFLAAFDHALRRGVHLTTAAWSSTRIGDGRFCGAQHGLRALTPDGYVSACTEVCEGSAPDDPFLVGRLDPVGRRLEIWPVREASLQARVGYDLPHCSTCFMVDTCAGGCASRARALTGDPRDRDGAHCIISRRVNPQLMADIADGRLLPDDGWQPIEAALGPGESSVPGMTGRLVALVPPFARRRWNADPDRRPAFAVPGGDTFFHLPPDA